MISSLQRVRVRVGQGVFLRRVPKDCGIPRDQLSTTVTCPPFPLLVLMTQAWCVGERGERGRGARSTGARQSNSDGYVCCFRWLCEAIQREICPNWKVSGNQRLFFRQRTGLTGGYSCLYILLVHTLLAVPNTEYRINTKRRQ